MYSAKKIAAAWSRIIPAIFMSGIAGSFPAQTLTGRGKKLNNKLLCIYNPAAAIIVKIDLFYPKICQNFVPQKRRYIYQFHELINQLSQPVRV